MTRTQALAKARAAVTANAKAAGYDNVMDYVRSFKASPKPITAAEAKLAFDRFYSNRGRYHRYHPGHSGTRAKAQDLLRSTGPKRIISDTRYARRPDRYDFKGLDTGRILPGTASQLAKYHTVKGSEAAKAAMKHARAVKAMHWSQRRRGAAHGLLADRYTSEAGYRTPASPVYSTPAQQGGRRAWY